MPETPSELQSAPRPAWQQRVIEERDALQRKLTALGRFMDELPVQYAQLHPADRYLLALQRSYMANYLSVLTARINRFEPPLPA